MLADLKPYPMYKDSGVPWLGTVPSHWEVRRIKTLFHEKDERSGDGQGVLLSLTRSRGIIPQSEASQKLASANDLSKYKVCRSGDLVMNRMQAWSGMFALSPLGGVVSPDYSVFSGLGPQVSKYFEHLFKTPILVSQFAQRSKGIGSGFNRLYTPDFGAIHATSPSLSEQATIVRFLDQLDRKLRRYVRNKQQLIKLLEEQKRAIIHHAVTRGLDPTVRLKPSGLEWLGKVPAHWRIVRLKFAASDIVDCLHATPVYDENGAYPAIRTADIEPGHVRLARARRVNHEHYVRWTERFAPRAGDILYSREGERYGLAAPVPADIQLCISQRMMVFRIRQPHSSAYLMWQLNCPHVYSQASADIGGATAPHVNINRIRNFEILLPPPEEQFAIASKIETDCRIFDVARSLAYRELSLLRELRARIFADVVTGKLDVRAAAVELPEETEEPLAEVVLEPEDSDDGDADEPAAEEVVE